MIGSMLGAGHGLAEIVRRYGVDAGIVELRRITGGFDSGVSFYTAARTAYSRATYETDRYTPGIDPVSVVAVDPSAVTRITGRQWKPWYPFDAWIGTVRPGSWDTDTPRGVPEIHRPYPKRFSEYPAFVAFRNHFQEGVPWEETAYYEQRTRLAESDRGSYPPDSVSDIEPYFRAFDRLYEDIRDGGYRSQFELSERDITTVGHDRSFRALLGAELLIDVGRDGELLFVDNRHRLAIAKLLGLSRIPAVVMCRHKQWLERLDSETADPVAEPYFASEE